MELTQDDIKEINKNAIQEWQENEQGIYKEPFGIPTHIKDYVIYMRVTTGGVSGGSYHSDSNPTPYVLRTVKNDFRILDDVLAKLKPDITYLQYKKINSIKHTNSETEYEYYGNSTDYEITYIILSELIDLLKTF